MGEGNWVKTPTARLRLRSDGILEIRCDDGAHDDIETVEAIVAALDRLVGPKGPVPVLAVLGNRRGVSPSGRFLVAGSEIVRRNVSRCALVASSSVATVVASIFIGLGTPVAPTKAFTTEEAAVAWLKGTPA